MEERIKDLTATLDAVNLEKQELQDSVNKQRDLIEKMKQDHQRELEKEKTSVEENKNHEIQGIKKDFLDMLTERNDKLTIVENENNLLKKNLKIIIEERDKFKDEVWRLKMKQNNAPIITTAVGLVSFGLGAGVGWYLRGRNTDPTLSVSIDYGKNTVYPTIQIPEPIMIQPDIHQTYSGGTLEINKSGSFYSGAVCHNNGAIYDSRYDAVQNQQEDGIHPSNYDNTSGINLVTTISGLQSPTVYVSSHLDSVAFTSYVETPGPIPSPFRIPINYNFITFQSPLPDDRSESFPMNKWRRLKGTSFEIYTEKLFGHKGCPTERLPYRNIAGDLIVTLNGICTVIECK